MQPLCVSECRTIDFREINASNYHSYVATPHIYYGFFAEGNLINPYRGFNWSSLTNIATIASCGTVNPPREYGRLPYAPGAKWSVWQSRAIMMVALENDVTHWSTFTAWAGSCFPAQPATEYSPSSLLRIVRSAFTTSVWLPRECAIDIAPLHNQAFLFRVGHVG